MENIYLIYKHSENFMMVFFILYKVWFWDNPLICDRSRI